MIVVLGKNLPPGPSPVFLGQFPHNKLSPRSTHLFLLPLPPPQPFGKCVAATPKVPPALKGRFPSVISPVFLPLFNLSPPHFLHQCSPNPGALSPRSFWPPSSPGLNEREKGFFCACISFWFFFLPGPLARSQIFPNLFLDPHVSFFFSLHPPKKVEKVR